MPEVEESNYTLVEHFREMETVTARSRTVYRHDKIGGDNDWNAV